MSGLPRRLGFGALVIMLAAGAFAQSVASGDMHVTVHDPQGALVKNATVTAHNEARGFDRTTNANADGDYQLLRLPPGQYSVSVEAPGFAKSVAAGVVITVGQIAEVPMTLAVAGGKEVVNVSSEAALVETERSSSTTTIDQQRIDNLPINGRNYINFTETNSQVTRDTAPNIGAAPTSGLNFSGQSARSNLVNVDGADAVDNSINGIRSTVSQEAVQEFQIITNGYSAEYGRASGGVVNIITRSGSNNFHGTLFGYLRNRDLQAVNPFSNVPDPAYTRVQAGATVSGPIIKDKTFFFFSYEITRRQETGFSNIGANNFGLVQFPTPQGVALLTPDQVSFIQANATNPIIGPQLPQYIALAAAASSVALTGNLPGVPAPFGHGFPPLAPGALPVPLPASFVPLQNTVGNFPISEGTSIYSLRLDHRLNANQSLFLRVGVSPSTVKGIEVNAQGPQNFGQNAFSRTSIQTYRDVSVTGQHTWTISNNKVNDFLFQFARRALLYNFNSDTPDGSKVAVNIPGFAFIGREPFSFINRVEKRFQFADNFSWTRGNHNVKFGADFNYIPVEADFTVNFGGVYNFGNINAFPAPFPAFSPIQAYGLGLPQNFVQGVGNPHDSFSNKALGMFIQDSWRIRPNLTLNYGVRYDIEFTPTFPAFNDESQAAYNALGITKGIPQDSNNIAPRIGIAWDPFKDGKTVVRASYGIFYDHPLLGLIFLADAADASHTVQLAFAGGTPGCSANPGQSLNAANTFQGILASCPGIAGFSYLPSEQRFNTAPNAPSLFVGQQFIAQGIPLNFLPFGYPNASSFVYSYSNQANLTLEHDLGHDFALSLEYNFNGGQHINRPINVNAVRSDLLIANWRNALAAGDPGARSTLGPLGVGSIGAPCGVGPTGTPWVASAIMNFLRPSGINPSFVPFLSQPGNPAGVCLQLAQQLQQIDGIGAPVPVPFADMVANVSSGSSVYHGLTANLRKRFSNHFQFLASYTWSHTIDDALDLQATLEPQDNYRPDLERSNSTFDQRHRFVFSGVYQTGRVSGGNFKSKLLSDWTFAPIIQIASGQPFNIISGVDQNFDFSTPTDRPRVVPGGTPVSSCGDPAAPSKFSPTGFLQPACFLDGTLTGNLGRNAGTKPWTLFNDLRVARRIHLTERVALDGMVDIFNIANKFNAADVNPLWDQNGVPTAAFDPRQIQLALKLSW